jgi:hypothetical protein
LKGPKKSQPPLEGKIFIVHPFNWAALWVSPPKKKLYPTTFTEWVHLIVIMYLLFIWRCT